MSSNTMSVIRRLVESLNSSRFLSPCCRLTGRWMTGRVWCGFQVRGDRRILFVFACWFLLFSFWFSGAAFFHSGAGWPLVGTACRAPPPRVFFSTSRHFGLQRKALSFKSYSLQTFGRPDILAALYKIRTHQPPG